MTVLRRVLLGCCVSLVDLMGQGGRAAAIDSKDLRDRPVRMVVPFPPGGPVDMAARLLTPSLTQALGQRVVVENRSGGSGTAGVVAVARAPADGQTLAFASTGALAVNFRLVSPQPYDTRRDLSPVSVIASVPSILAVNSSFPAMALGELIKAAEAHPGDVTFASGGVGTSSHLALELLKQRSGIDVLHVPYRGGAPALAAVLAGEAHATFLDASILMPHIGPRGSLRALALTSLSRSPVMPNLPTMAEAGVADAEIENWYALVAPARTPADRIQRLFRAVSIALSSPHVHDTLGQEATKIIGSPPDEAATFIASEIEKWGQVCERAHITSL